MSTPSGDNDFLQIAWSIFKNCNRTLFYQTVEKLGGDLNALQDVPTRVVFLLAAARLQEQAHVDNLGQTLPLSQLENATATLFFEIKHNGVEERAMSALLNGIHCRDRAITLTTVLLHQAAANSAEIVDMICTVAARENIPVKYADIRQQLDGDPSITPEIMARIDRAHCEQEIGHCIATRISGSDEVIQGHHIRALEIAGTLRRTLALNGGTITAAVADEMAAQLTGQPPSTLHNVHYVGPDPTGTTTTLNEAIISACRATINSLQTETNPPSDGTLGSQIDRVQLLMASLPPDTGSGSPSSPSPGPHPPSGSGSIPPFG